MTKSIKISVLWLLTICGFAAKEKAYAEILRTLKPGGELLACFYVAGEKQKARM